MKAVAKDKVAWITSGDCLIIKQAGNPKPIILQKSNKKYDFSSKLIRENRQKDLIDYLWGEKTLKVQAYTKGKFQIKDNGDVYLKNQKKPLHPLIGKLLADFFSEGLPYTPLISFSRNLNKNPDPKAREQLFGFLKKYNHPLTPDGYFLAYKKVNRLANGKLVDGYSKKIDNSVGKIVRVKRSEVDPNPDNECSHGLHVAAYPYAMHEYSGDVLLTVKVNPKNVVAIPRDYQFQKMRVCEYQPICEGKKEMDKTYITNYEIKKKMKESIQKFLVEDEISIVGMTAREIVELVTKKTGTKITMSLKNKQPIIKKATQIFKEKGFKIIDPSKQVVLEGKTAKQIVTLVKNEIGENITISLKNKKSIIKKAIELLESREYSIR